MRKNNKQNLKDPLEILTKIREKAVLEKTPSFKEINKLLKQDNIRIQERLLTKILKKNSTSKYGKKYSFKKIKSIEEYQKKVPIITFPDIEKYVEEMKNGKEKILTSNKVIYFAITSGTTSKPKYIPITKIRIKLFIKQIMLLARLGPVENFKGMKGKTLGLAGTDIVGYTKAKIPYGNISGYLINNIPQYLKKRLAIPMDIYRIKDYEERTRLLALKALQKNISQFVFAEPIEAILFFDYLKNNKEKLIRELKIFGKKSLVKKLEKKEFIPAKIWPNIKIISCFKSSFNQLYLNTLKDKIGNKDIIIRDPGIYSSEGGITLGICNKGSSAIPQYNNIFFEFIDIENKKSTPLTLNKLQEGKTYEIVITTQEGLYRYNIEDRVKVTGFKKKLPLLEFVGRNKSLDVAGEKCPEEEIIKAIQKAFKKNKFEPKAYTIFPKIKDQNKKPKYGIIIELKKEDSKFIEKAKKIIKDFDKELQDKVLDYENMRNEYGRLEAPEIVLVKKGSYDKFEKKRIMQTGQPKIINVTKDQNFKENFDVEKIISK